MTRLRIPAPKPPGVSRHAALLPVLALLLLAALSGCGSASADEDGVATLSDAETADTTSDDDVPTDPQERALAFAECMRDNGVPDFPDPEFDEEGNPQFKVERRVEAPSGGSTDAPAGEKGFEADPGMQQAMEACEHLSPRAEMSEEDRQAMQDAALEYAQCMRDHGVDMPDPQFNGDGGMLQQGPRGINPDDPTFQAAQEACEDILGDLRAETRSGGQAS